MEDCTLLSIQNVCEKVFPEFTWTYMSLPGGIIQFYSVKADSKPISVFLEAGEANKVVLSFWGTIEYRASAVTSFNEDIWEHKEFLREFLENYSSNIREKLLYVENNRNNFLCKSIRAGYLNESSID